MLLAHASSRLYSPFLERENKVRTEVRLISGEVFRFALKNGYSFARTFFLRHALPGLCGVVPVDLVHVFDLGNGCAESNDHCFAVTELYTVDLNGNARN
jgi:hypothetical protein